MRASIAFITTLYQKKINEHRQINQFAILIVIILLFSNSFIIGGPKERCINFEVEARNVSYIIIQ